MAETCAICGCVLQEAALLEAIAEADGGELLELGIRLTHQATIRSIRG